MPGRVKGLEESSCCARVEMLLEHPHPCSLYPAGRAFGGPGHDGPPHRYPGNGSFKSGLAKKSPLSHHFLESQSFLGAPKSRLFFGRFRSIFFLRAVRFLFLARWRVVGVDNWGSDVVVAGTLAESRSKTCAQTMMLNSKELSAGGRHREWALATNRSGEVQGAAGDRHRLQHR